MERLGRYRLMTLLGQGANGQVWEAVLEGPAGFQKQVAVKVLKPGVVDPGQTDALIEEARVGARICHPNVVGTHDLGQVDGTWYLAMDLVDGSSLAVRQAEGPLLAAALVDIGMQVCDGLEAIHAHGLVHRDIKPANLLLARDGRVRIADLGLARMVGDLAPAAGTAGFLPPEQLYRREDHRADLFALGATLFMLATGSMPWGKGHEALRRVHGVDRLLEEGLTAPLDAIVPGLGPVVERCLQSDPRARWPDAAGLRAAHPGHHQPGEQGNLGPDEGLCPEVLRRCPVCEGEGQEQVDRSAHSNGGHAPLGDRGAGVLEVARKRDPGKDAGHRRKEHSEHLPKAPVGPRAGHFHPGPAPLDARDSSTSVSTNCNAGVADEVVMRLRVPELSESPMMRTDPGATSAEKSNVTGSRSSMGSRLPGMNTVGGESQACASGWSAVGPVVAGEEPPGRDVDIVDPQLVICGDQDGVGLDGSGTQSVPVVATTDVHRVANDRPPMG